MNKLILFSGGVESTAMMTIKDDSDIVITIEDESPKEIPTFKKSSVEAISKAMNFEVNYCKIKLPVERPEKIFVYQLWLFTSIASLWVKKDESIEEVWYGLNSSEPNSYCREQFDRIVKGWEILHPKVKLVFPLWSLSKDHQWRIIPDNIKPLVRNCVFNIDCGKCRKCLEMKNLKGSFLHR